MPAKSPDDLPRPPEHDPREIAPRVSSAPQCALLAVDAGLRAGLSGWSRQGRLLWQRSLHLQNRDALKRFQRGLLRTLPHLQTLALEGGGAIADTWLHAAHKRNLQILACAAEDWRQALLHPREQRSGECAKETAVALARKVMLWSGVPRPKTMRHDAAEAVLLGLYAVQELGWLEVGAAEVLR